MENDHSTMNMGDPPPMSGLMTFASDRLCQGDSKVSRLQQNNAEIRSLKSEVERLRAERDRLLESQKAIMELLGTTKSDRLLHDLRNVLNERALFRALAETVM